MYELLYVLFQIAIVAFLLNFVWEVWHSELYTTTLQMQYVERLRLLTDMSFRDALWIALFYFLSFLIFGVVDITTNVSQLVFFCVIALLAGYTNERISIKRGRWEYAPTMPTVFGVGVTPLLELVATGFLSFIIVFLLF